MKLKSFVTILLGWGGSLAVQATPILNVQVNQGDDEVALNWSVSDAGLHNQGLALYVTAFDPFRHQVTGVFLGWWNATAGEIGGTIAQGWMDAPSSSVAGQNYIPYNSGHWSNIFCEGTHDVFGCFFDEGSSLPSGYTPDGQIGGNGMWLESSYTIAAPSSVAKIPDIGSTLGMITVGMAGLWAGLARRRKASESSTSR